MSLYTCLKAPIYDPAGMEGIVCVRYTYKNEIGECEDSVMRLSASIVLVVVATL